MRANLSVMCEKGEYASAQAGCWHGTGILSFDRSCPIELAVLPPQLMAVDCMSPTGHSLGVDHQTSRCRTCATKQ